MSIPEGATQLGTYFYLFKSSINVTDCLISAHGGYVTENRSFTVPDGVEIWFYGEHGAALIDPNITTFAKILNVAESVEVFRGGQRCRNYLLSKYQGKHAGADGKTEVETYQQIIDTIRGEERQRRAKMAQMQRAKGVLKDGFLKQAANIWGGSILTVRNRWNVFMGVPLLDAIKAARKEMPTLKYFHAVFCRSNMLGDDPKAAQSVKMKPVT